MAPNQGTDTSTSQPKAGKNFSWTRLLFWIWLLNTVGSAAMAALQVYELDAIGNYVHYTGIKLAFMLVLAGIVSWFFDFLIGAVGWVILCGFIFGGSVVYGFFSSNANQQTPAKNAPTKSENTNSEDGFLLQDADPRFTDTI